MSVLDQYGNATSSQYHLYGSSNRFDKGLQWTPDFNRDLEDLFNANDWRSTLTQSRLICANFGVPRAAIIQKADWAVGKAWDPQFLGADKDWADEHAKPFLEDWYKICDVRGDVYDFKSNLWLDSFAIDRDGDFFVLLTQTRSGYPQTQRIPAHRVGSRSDDMDGVKKGRFKGFKINKGIIKNKIGRPVACKILADEAKDDKIIPFSDIIHVLDPEYHDQDRGIPAFTASIKELRQAKTSEEWELMAQMMLSSHALIEYNEQGGPDLDDPTHSFVSTGEEDNNLVVQSYSGGMVKHFKSNSGGKVESISHNRPGDMWDTFQDRIQRTACAGANWPVELAWKMDGLNGVSIRNVQERARHSVEARQCVLKRHALRIITWALAKAIKHEYIPAPSTPSDWRKWTFNMPPKLSIDPRHDAKTQIESYKLGAKNMTEILQDQSKTHADHIRERCNEIVERKIIKAEVEAANPGVTIDDRELQMLNPNEMAPEEPNTQSSDE